MVKTRLQYKAGAPDSQRGKSDTVGLWPVCVRVFMCTNHHIYNYVPAAVKYFVVAFNTIITKQTLRWNNGSLSETGCSEGKRCQTYET